ncbi:hypothetical protein QBC39DRAFT_367258 [Podospora conica]|nr:hypothetical protein QBC39DRAFT_367258 [Schizothecium conicum]
MTQLAPTDTHLQWATFYFDSFAFYYNRHITRHSWTAELDEVANHAIQRALDQLANDGHTASFSHVAFIATTKFYKYIRGGKTWKYADEKPEPHPGMDDDVAYLFHNNPDADHLGMLEDLARSMTCSTATLNRPTPTQHGFATCAPALAPAPVPSVHPVDDDEHPLTTQLNKLFRGSFTVPIVTTTHEKCVPMPPWSIPLPRAVNLQREVWTPADKTELQRCFSHLGLQSCKETHTLRLELSRYAQNLYAGIDSLEDCPKLEEQIIEAYGWLNTWLVDMHEARKAIAVAVHLRGYMRLPRSRQARTLAEAKSLFTKWRKGEWKKYIKVIRRSDGEAPIETPTAQLSQFLKDDNGATSEPLPVPSTKAQSTTPPPTTSTTSNEILDNLTSQMELWVRQESPSLDEIKQAVRAKSPPVLGLLRALRIQLSDTKVNKELMESWKRSTIVRLKDLREKMTEDGKLVENPDDHLAAQ